MPWTLWIRELCPEGGCAGCCRTHVSIPGPIHEMPVISSPRHPYPAMTTSSVQLVSRVQLCDPMDCSTHTWLGSPGGLVVKNLPARAGDAGSIPGWEDSLGTDFSRARSGGLIFPSL